ncbi:MAG: hypothetical protein ACQESG_02010 [Nanobdellota archaeon]
MIRRCKDCRKFLFFSKAEYCEDCAMRREEERKAEEKRRLREKRKRDQERAKIKNRIADERLREELARSIKTKTPKREKAPVVPEAKHEVQRPAQTLEPSKEDILMYPRLLYVKVAVNHIQVTEWIDGKKRQAVNKRREVRRTHAGGFSAEKFQRFVDQKKKKTFEWVVDVLTRPGVLKPPYDKIIVEAKDEDLKRALDCFFSDEGYLRSEQVG